jgi:hypothetical protein
MWQNSSNWGEPIKLNETRNACVVEMMLIGTGGLMAHIVMNELDLRPVQLIAGKPIQTDSGLRRFDG